MKKRQNRIDVHEFPAVRALKFQAQQVLANSTFTFAEPELVVDEAVGITQKESLEVAGCIRGHPREEDHDGCGKKHPGPSATGS